MAVKRATFTCTVDANGVAEDDVRLSGIPTSASRHAFLECVTFDDSAAGVQADGLYIYAVENDADSVVQTTSQLFQIDHPDTGSPYYPRIPTVDAQGVAATEPSARILIKTATVRVKVTGPLVAGDVYTVVLYFETAGDYRF